ncbi:MAG: DUF7305 domain-containing protein [Egibacteraceae bacterium]
MMERVRTTMAWERGSMPLALLATIVVSGLLVVVVANTLFGQRLVRLDRDFSESVQSADVGVQQALYLLNAGELQNLPLTSTSPAGNPQTAPQTLTIDGNTVTWTAERLNEREWQITSDGTQNSVTRTVVSQIEEQPLFFPGAFGDEGMALNGTSSKVDSYNSEACTSVNVLTCWDGNETTAPYGTGNGAIGSNKDIDFSGNTKVARIMLYDWDDNPGAGVTATDPGGTRCDGESSGSPCIQPGVVRTIGQKLDYGSDEKVQFLVDKLASSQCQSQDLDGNGVRDIERDWTYPSGSVIVPKELASAEPDDPTHPDNTNFYCFKSVTFGKNVTLDAAAQNPDSPVVIYVRDKVSVPSSQSKVNCPGCDKNNVRAVAPTASSLQIFTASDVASGGGDVSMSGQSLFTGVVYAPQARCNGAGGGVDVYGSLLCGIVENVGNWAFHYDDALGNYGTGAFNVATWREES